jgi:dipeptidase
MRTIRLIACLCFFTPFFSIAQDKPDYVNGFPDGCTSITCGKKATIDGSVITSHTDDSHRTRSNINVIPPKDYKAGSMEDMTRRVLTDSFPMPLYIYKKIGEIPQVAHTYGYINTAYPCVNDHQLAIGESTFGGREELHSDSGLIDCTQLVALMVERCSTARQAIQMAGELTAKYGYNDEGECLTIADKKEVWHLEIVGPGKGKRGSVWVAQRVPDDEVSVNANASRIRQIDLSKPDFFMASENIFDVAKQNGWWDPAKGAFEFCYAYAPESRTSAAGKRREWRVFDLLAPSLKLDPNSENYPFSVKPDQPVTLEKIAQVFKDYYEGTEFNMVKDLIVVGDSGKAVISPVANPFMPYDMNKMLRINGGWGWYGERTIARWYTMYGTIIQCRDWLPDEIGGVAWIALDNIASSIYIPVYCSVTDMPAPYKVDGRRTGMSRTCAWWAFNYMGTTAAHRWGDMRKDVDAAWGPWQSYLFGNQRSFEAEALKLYDPKKPEKTREFLTKYTNDWGIKVVDKAWQLGDFLWTKYDEKF